MRIQKYLANHTAHSRREVERFIADGQIYYNGTLAVIGQKVVSGDRIDVSGQTYLVKLSNRGLPQVVMLNKPLGVISSTKDDQSRPTVFDLLPVDSVEKWIMVGRLDVNTTGLLLFTNHGDFANQLMHPRSQLIRRYHVRVFGEVTQDTVNRLVQGVHIDGQRLSFKTCKLIPGRQSAKNTWYEVEVVTGQYRMIRRLWESQSVRVSRLVRVAYGSVSLPKSLRIGASQSLSDDRVVQLMKDVSFDQ